MSGNGSSLTSLLGTEPRAGFRGRWAVKETFRAGDEEDVRLTTELQEAAVDAGVPTPRVRRTTGNRVRGGRGRQFRVFEWVDVLAPDPLLDPVRVGEVVGAIHQLPGAELGDLDPWSHEPVGAARWDELVTQLRKAGAPVRGEVGPPA